MYAYIQLSPHDDIDLQDAPDINKSHGILPALNVSLMQQDVARFVELLQHHNLAFTVEVTCDLRDPLSDDVNLHITNHLTAHRLVLPQGPSSDSSSLTAFHSRRWIVMEKSRATDGRFKLKYASSLEENEFHLSWVRVHGLKLAQPPDAYVLVVGAHDVLARSSEILNSSARSTIWRYEHPTSPCS